MRAPETVRVGHPGEYVDHVIGPPADKLGPAERFGVRWLQDHGMGLDAEAWLEQEWWRKAAEARAVVVGLPEVEIRTWNNHLGRPTYLISVEGTVRKVLAS